MLWLGIGVIVALGAVILLSIVIGAVFWIKSYREKEKGPMPKNHGGFAQRVTGGKS